jgi:transmembrane sensor
LHFVWGIDFKWLSFRYKIVCMLDQFYLLLSKKLTAQASSAELEELERLCLQHEDFRKQEEFLTKFWKENFPEDNQEEESNRLQRHLHRMKEAGFNLNLQEGTTYPLSSSTSAAEMDKDGTVVQPEHFSPNSPSDNSATKDVPHQMEAKEGIVKADELEWEEPQDSDAENHASKVVPISTKKMWFRWAVAACVLFAIATYSWRLLGNANGLEEERTEVAQSVDPLHEIQTRAGNRTKVTLPDGTEVWVNGGSRLSYDPNYGKTNRNIQLNGEAYFVVAKNKKLPFIIHTQTLQVKATGTIFNVRAYQDEDRVETALLEGSVEVKLNNLSNKTWYLKPSDKLVIGEKGMEEVLKTAGNSSEKKSEADRLVSVQLDRVSYQSADSMVTETAWLYNTLAFNNESFVEVARKMEKWYGVEFVFETLQLEQIRFTGAFTTETVWEALQAMQYTARFKFKKNDRRIIIYQ